MSLDHFSFLPRKLSAQFLPESNGERKEEDQHDHEDEDILEFPGDPWTGLSTINKQLRCQVSGLKERCKILEDQNNALSLELSRRQDDPAAHHQSGKVDRLETKLADALGCNADLEATLASLSSLQGSHIIELEKRAETILCQSQEMKSLQDQNGVLKKELESKDKTIAKQVAKIENLKALLDKVQGSHIIELEKRVETILGQSQEMKSLQHRNGLMKKELESKDTTIAQQAAKIEHLKALFDEAGKNDDSVEEANFDPNPLVQGNHPNLEEGPRQADLDVNNEKSAPKGPCPPLSRLPWDTAPVRERPSTRFVTFDNQADTDDLSDISSSPEVSKSPPRSPSSLQPRIKGKLDLTKGKNVPKQRKQEGTLWA